MRRQTRLLGWQQSWILVALILGAGIETEAFADVTEVRDFVVQVDDKQVGSNQLTIVNRDDGSTVVQNKAEVQVKILITYKYSYQATEQYQGYQLLRLDGKCNDNFKTFDVHAFLTQKRDALHVQANNATKSMPANTWTSSYWKLPEAKYHNKAIPVMDVDRGELFNAQLQYVGTEQRNIVGKAQKCYHFRVTGGDYPVDLWFDVQHRLLRQEFVERGHRTIIECVQIRRSR